MSNHVSRRSFVKTAGAALAGAAALTQATPAQAGKFTGRIKKAVKYGMVKGDMSVLDKFKMLKDLGFDGVEPGVREKVDHEEMRKASEKTGLPIHGVVLGSVNGINKAVDLAVEYGSTSVLLVAGRVSDKMPYAKNYEETQATIRASIPYAKEKGILLLVENVWNNFLISPIELARYIDELQSDQVGVYFDIGNVGRYGWPEHWIPVLGDRIHKLDIKAYSQSKQMKEGPWKGFDCKIGDDEINWSAVRAELAKIDYHGWATAEVGGGGRERLADISQRMDKVLDL
ncbi:MAG: sugar phosphate isomerase/epimerase [bacterium]|nr:sugar phosphate isomerase/epimerase [bacterium]